MKDKLQEVLDELRAATEGSPGQPLLRVKEAADKLERLIGGEEADYHWDGIGKDAVDSSSKKKGK